MLSVAIRFHSLPLAALGKYIFSPHGKLELFALFVVENEYFEYDEFIQCTMHPRVQRIKTNAECSHSIPFVAACGIRKIHLLAAW
jgi:hypothetical protein